MRLNLFCNKHGIDGWVNVDIEKHPEYEGGEFLQADIAEGWRLGESSVDHIRAYDGPEHLPDPIDFMNQAHYTLKPGGILEIWVPSTDGRGAFQDPTHKSFWNPNSFYYYMAETRNREFYPQITAAFDFRVMQFESDEAHQIKHVFALGKCVKDGVTGFDGEEEVRALCKEITKRNAPLNAHPQFRDT